MALKYEVDSLDGLDEGIKALYAEKDGKFLLQVDGLDDGAELKTALQSERALRKTAERQVKDVKDGATEAARLAAEQAGDFEQLYKAGAVKLEETATALASLKTGIATEKQQNAAMRIAGDLAEGANVDLLSTFISKRLQHTDDGVKVLDAAGQLTVATVEDLKKEIAGDARFGSLLKGNQSSGGGSGGAGDGGGAAEKTLTREQFGGLDPKGQMAHVKGGGEITD
jgi:hypothetical protein